MEESQIQEKQTAIFNRLSNHQKSRRRRSSARRSSSPPPSFESIKSFLAQFSESQSSIQSDLRRPILTKPDLDNISSSISNLEKLVSDHSYFLPPYDLRSSLKAIEDLKQIVQNLNSQIAPRKKFSFKSKICSDKKGEILAEKSDVVSNAAESRGFGNEKGGILLKEFGDSESEVVSNAAKSDFGVHGSPGFGNEKGGILLKKFGDSESEVVSNAAKSDFGVRESLGFGNEKGVILLKKFGDSESEGDFDAVSNAAKSDFGVRESPGFRNKKGGILVKNFGDCGSEGDFSIVDLDSCDVYLKGRFKGFFVHRIKNCRVFVGPVMGSVLIEEVKDCFFMLASHQIRIHDAKKCDFYLRVRSRPIVEDCEGVRFAPYRLFYQGINKDLSDSGLEEETGNWANVDDFLWLRNVQSPNWCLIPEEEFVGVRDVSELEEKSDDL